MGVFFSGTIPTVSSFSPTPEESSFTGAGKAGLSPISPVSLFPPRNKSGNTISAARPRVEKDRKYAYRDRRVRKRDFRALWIQRINAAVRLHELTYSRFISGLAKAGIELDRKVMADLAMNQPDAFKGLCDKARAAL